MTTLLDRKHEPGAYLSYQHVLYCVENYEPHGATTGGKLNVVKITVDTETDTWLNDRQVKLSKLEQAAPENEAPV